MNHSSSSPTPPRRSFAEGVNAFSRLFRAKSPAKAATPGKNDSTALQTIILPQARTRWMHPHAAQMTPGRIEQILRSALTGDSPAKEQELYTLMESTWPRLMKNVLEVKEAVLSLDWNLMEPAEEEQLPGAKELVARCKNGMKGDPCADGHGWRSTLSALLDAWFRGISISEIDWEYRSGRKTQDFKTQDTRQDLGKSIPPAWLPRQTRDIPAWHYGWQTDTGRLMLYPNGSSADAIDFPENKFLIAIRKAGKGHPSGTALLRTLAWWWCSANFSQEWLLNFAQIFGQPFRWATYDGAQDGVKEDLSTMMEQMGSAAWGIGPEGTKVEWHESGKSGADNPQAYILTLADTACDLLVLGQTLTSTQGSSGSLALGEVHQSVRADIIDSAAAWLAEVLNEQLVPAIISLNHGETGEDSTLPWFQPTRKSKQDTKVLAETFEIILRSGIPLVQEEVYDALDMSMPQDDDKTFGPISNLKSQISNPEAAASPDLRRLLAKLPLDAREYVLARL